MSKTKEHTPSKNPDPFLDDEPKKDLFGEDEALLGKPSKDEDDFFAKPLDEKPKKADKVEEKEEDDPNKCQACDGTGLKSQAQRCFECQGYGKVNHA